jgi:hypothetical protein
VKAKTKLLFVFLMPLAIQVNGQLTVNAGNDTTLCMCTDTLRPGGNPTASGGMEPYSYKWELLPVYFNDYQIQASELLNDSTSANPLIDCSTLVNDTVTLVLTVTDADFNSIKDSVKIIISSISFIHAMYIRPTINQGDSVQLRPANIINGIAPFSYQWTPETGLSDPNIRNPYAKPDTTTRYICIVTDALGCSATDLNDVIVIPTGISKFKKPKFASVVFPNPITPDSQIQFSNPSNKKLNILVVNLKGQVILDDWYYSDNYDIGRKINRPGTYFYSIKDEKEILTTGKFVKN